MAKQDLISNSASGRVGQGNSSYLSDSRIIYPAIVVPDGTNDSSEQNRIRARIVSIDEETGKIKGKKSSFNEENYNNYSGKDRTILDEDLVLCIPLIPQFFHVKPQPGEMVFVLMENPKDSSSVRYWIGPIINSQLKLNYQGYEDAVKIFNKTSFISNPKKDNSTILNALLPGPSDVAVQGRNDADLILKNKELMLVAGKFEDYKNFIINTEHLSFLRLQQINNETQVQQNRPPTIIKHKITAEISKDKDENFVGTIIVTNVNKKTNQPYSELQLVNNSNSYKDKNFTVNWLNEQISQSKRKYPNWQFVSKSPEFKSYPVLYNLNNNLPSTNNESVLKKYSQASITSTNINIYSPRGKFRGNDIKSFELNSDLKSFGSFSDTLHPAVFGDELVRVLDLIIRTLLNHIHTPQSPLLSNALSDELKSYTVDGNLQNLISNHIRIN
jgi:hypothetical protein